MRRLWIPQGPWGAIKVGSRDDLETALGLALQDDGPERAWIYMGD